MYLTNPVHVRMCGVQGRFTPFPRQREQAEANQPWRCQLRAACLEDICMIQMQNTSPP